MPLTAWRRTSSAWRKVPWARAFLGAASRRRSLGMVMMVSTRLWSSLSPASATFIRREPSKKKGLVTTATVRQPCSLARSATTGPAPVPVPPPRPAARKTMSAPSTTAWMASIFSSAACRPSSGLAPVPNPRVVSQPSWTLVWALDFSRSWQSVLKTMNSTPVRPDSIMLLTAFPPAPPRPMTLILADWPLSTSSKVVSYILSPPLCFLWPGQKTSLNQFFILVMTLLKIF